MANGYRIAHLRRRRAVLRRQKSFKRVLNPLNGLTDEDIFCRYRFRRETILFLVTLLSPAIQYHTSKSMAVSPLIQILATLRFLATGSFYRLVGDSLGLSIASVARSVDRVTSAVCRLSRTFIKFPTGQYLSDTKKKFFELAGRNIALWKSTNQFSTFDNFTSDIAVDGNIGNYEMSSVSYPNILKRSSNYSLSLTNNGHVVEIIQTDGKPHRKDEIVLQQPVFVTSVKIGLPNKPSEESVLSLCEVEVFEKECSKNDLKLMKLKINETSCSSSPCLSGEKINVQCVEGYTVKGSGYVTCGKDGNWSFDTTCKANTCLLPNDVHTRTNVTGQSNVVKFGTAITITCDSGYHVKSSIDLCQLNGTWSSTGLITAPLCIANTCLLPNDVHTHTNVTGQSNVVKFETAITIACDSGYHVKSSIDRCQLNGTWSSTGLITAPLCIENTCSLPTNNEHARINQTAGEEYVRIGTAVKIKCDIGYILKIPEEVFCQLNGTWNFNWDRSLPVCEDLENGNQNSYVEIVTETELTNDDTARESSGYYSFLSNKAISKNAIKIENFINYVEENKGKNGSIVSQFSNLLTGLQYPAKVACFQQNKLKNKYKNIYACTWFNFELKFPNLHHIEKF
ncbi:hypothetical protein KUTeg_015944 [Tegillarca granosa]|uniref:Sushi domain-containing protein n=1 Tax=Tegillarca granosa TaxID=220873 RepID=A0ABQ9EKM9_TEGGR|nr:hypothetical protein KUTeg_015944 [Tegillarca granosa]